MKESETKISMFGVIATNRHWNCRNTVTLGKTKWWLGDSQAKLSLPKLNTLNFTFSISSVAASCQLSTLYFYLLVRIFFSLVCSNYRNTKYSNSFLDLACVNYLAMAAGGYSRLILRQAFRQFLQSSGSTSSTLLKKPAIAPSLACWVARISSFSTLPTTQLSKPLSINSTIKKPTSDDIRKAFTASPEGIPQSPSNAFYASFRIHTQSFLVTVGDTVTLPFRLKNVNVGDTLRVTQIETFGNRNFTLKGEPFVDEKLCLIRARVIEHTKEPMRVKLQTKKRNRRVKHIQSKHPYTVLKISEISIADESL